MYITNFFGSSAIQKQKECHSATEVKISEQAAFLCQKYIEARFTRSELCYYDPKRKNEKPFVECSEDVVRTLCEVGALLEKGYPKLYSNVLDQLNCSPVLGIIAANMFNRVSEQIISSGVSWARIIALYAFAGALAYDFTQVGEARLVRCLATWMKQFSTQRLSSWIRKNGGWVSIFFLYTRKHSYTNALSERSVQAASTNLLDDFSLFTKVLFISLMATFQKVFISLRLEVYKSTS